MQGFDVLDPNLSLFQSRFIEASAGTGKTFLIENIVCRLLMEPNGPTIDQILIVTFTKKATRELKTRILKRIEKGIEECKGTQEKRRLSHALNLFDEAKIFTIHGFCLFALKEFAFDCGFFHEEAEKEASLDASISIIKDFLRTELDGSLVHPKQLKKVQQYHQHDPELFFKKLALLASERIPIQGCRPLSEIKKEIAEVIENLKKSFSLEKDKVEEDLFQHARCFGKMCDLQKNLKKGVVGGLKKVALLLEGESVDFFDLPLLKMTPENRLKRAKLEKELFYPGLLESMQKTLFPLLEEASDPLKILGILADNGRIFLEHAIEKKELVFFDDLIKKMEKASSKEPFATKLRSLFKAVLIDEFQDTDPMQWRIFSNLFQGPSFSGPLYLVGDPKQSIYRFRGADVYTFLQAKREMGSQQEASLLGNWRSDPPLVDALNAFFSNDFLFLPKTKETIRCPAVKASTALLPPFSDAKGSLHFCKADSEEELFQFVLSEIRDLHERERIPFEEIAVLVKDRYQAARFSGVCPFPHALQENGFLCDTEGFAILETVLKAIIDPFNRQMAAVALFGPFFDNRESKVEDKIADLVRYHEILEAKGILALFHALLNEPLNVDEKIFLQMRQTVEILAKRAKTKEEILSFLEELKKEGIDEYKVRMLEEKNSIPVMTIHASKGLEFYVVFPVGLAIGSSGKREFTRDEGTFVLKQNKEEEDAEKMRQLYVACTRAKKRVYVPLIKKEQFSPINQFLNGRNLDEWVGKIPNSTQSSCEGFSECPSYQEKPVSLIPPRPLALQFPRLSLYSYSMLARREHRMQPKESVSPLPSGAETGDILHRILEEIPFTIADEALSNFILPYLKNTHLEPFLEETLNLVKGIFSTPFQTKERSFYLRDLDPAKMIRELEFLYPTDEPAGFCKGFIDLFFEHDGAYFFVDWKSNNLGKDYSIKSMQAAMEEHQYGLQAKIYSEAVLKLLNMTQQNGKFMGCFYAFLRGPSLLFLPREKLL